MALEILGGVCAVGQLAGQCSYVLEVVDKVRRSTDTLKGYQTQLQDLRSLCEVVKRNPLLQTTEVISHAQSILRTTEQLEDITLLLQKRRLHRVWAFLRVERRLVEHTKNIEILKSTLAISIQDQQCRILHNMDKRAQRTSAIPNMRKLYQDGSTSKRDAKFDSRSNFWDEGNSGTGMEVVVRNPGRLDQPPQRSKSEAQIAYTPDTQPGGARSTWGHHSRMSRWTNNTAHAGVSQVNGITVKGLTTCSGGPIDASGQRWAYNRKNGRGSQTNGYNFMSSDDNGYLSMPKVLGGDWHDNEHSNSQNDNDYAQGRSDDVQYNGHVYEHGAGRNV